MMAPKKTEYIKMITNFPGSDQPLDLFIFFDTKRHSVVFI